MGADASKAVPEAGPSPASASSASAASASSAERRALESQWAPAEVASVRLVVAVETHGAARAVSGVTI